MKGIIASIILFTRIPVWKLNIDIPKGCYDRAVVYWPLVGWLTGGVTATIMLVCSLAVPWPMAVIAGIIARVLLTGALHEDGLADFCDGFGCGGGKERILSIMKDSHIGTYGVIGLILYYALFTATLSGMDSTVAALAVFAADPFAKLCASQITNLLPYARPEGAKNKISYARMTFGQILFQIIAGSLPAALLIAETGPAMAVALIVPVIAVALLIRVMRRRIGGYTGDCCGATFIMCELAMLIAINIIWFKMI